MNNIRRFLLNHVLFVLTAVIFFTSCSNPRYINSPAVHNVAFFKEQGDFKFSVAGAGNPAKIFSKIDDNDTGETLDHSLGFDGQAAVAVTNHFMITAGAMYRREQDKYDNDDLKISSRSKVNYHRRMFDIGAGFFTPIGQSEKVFFNGVLGVGFGSMSSDDNGLPYDAARYRSYKADLIKYYLTPSFNFFFNDYLRMAIAPKFSLLKLNNIKTNYTTEEEISLGYEHARNHTFGLFEPSVLLQTGFRNNEWLKLDFGFNFASDPFTSRTKKGRYVDYPDIETYNVESRNFIFSIGLSFYPMRK